MDFRVNIGIVGVGRMGKFHLEKFLGLSDCEVIGFFDVNPDTSRSVEETLEVKAFPSLSELLYEADAVVIAASTEHHIPLAKKALFYWPITALTAPDDD